MVDKNIFLVNSILRVFELEKSGQKPK